MHSKILSQAINKALSIPSEYLLFGLNGIYAIGDHETIFVKTDFPFETVIKTEDAAIFKKLNSELVFTEKPFTVQYDKGKFRLNTLDRMFVPNIEEFVPTVTVNADGDRLKYGLNKCLKTHDPDRDFLNGVWFLKDHLFSGNGIQLTWFDFDTDLEFLLSTGSAKTLLTLIDDDVKIEFGGRVRFTSGESVYTTQVLAVRTPKKITLPESTGEWKINLDTFLDSVQRCILFSSNEIKKIKLSFKNDLLILHTEGENGQIAEKIPIEGNQELEINMDGQRLLCLGSGIATVTHRDGLLFETTEKVFISPIL